MHNYKYSFVTISRFFFCFLSFIFCTRHNATAQEFGGNSPRLKWGQINTDTARIIFPLGMEEQAQRVANTVHHLNKMPHNSIGDKFKKVNIALQNQTVVSNGYVAVAPFRSELFTTPPQSGYLVSSNWLDILSIHEYRHVQQFTNAKRGLTNFGYVLFGEMGWNYFASLSIPNWFMEGDAVVTETALTNQGRGRLPSFYNGFKSLSFEDRYYSYAKIRNGSLKDFVPDRYAAGFLMVNYGREKYGNDFWKDILNEAGSYNSLFYPFSRSLYKKSELPTYDFYIMSLRYYNEKWDSLMFKPETTKIEKYNNVDKNDTYTIYNYPYFDKYGDVIVYKSSYKNIGAFYTINQYGTEIPITKQGRVLDDYFSFKNGRLLWAEIGQDERWGWNVNSNIIMYDMNTYQRTKITRSTKYFSPDITVDGSKIIAAHASVDQEYSLHVLSVEGAIIKEIPNPANLYFAYPKWSYDEKYIISIARDKLGRNSLVKVDPESGEVENLTKFSDNQLGPPWLGKDFIYFSSTYSGTDNIFAVELGNDTIYQVTDVKVGAYQPAFSEEQSKLYYTDYSYLGSDIITMETERSKWKPIEINEPKDLPEFQFVSSDSEGGDITEDLPNKEYEITKYSQSSKLINVHSWNLYLEDPNYEWAFRSNNILNTLSLDLGARYNRNDNNFTYFFNGIYAQLYPVLSFGISTSPRAGLKYIDDGTNVIDTVKVTWLENKIKAGLLLPFDFSGGRYTNKFNIYSNYSYTAIRFKKTEQVETTDFNLSSVETGVSFVNRRKKARQSIFAKNSQYIKTEYNTSIDDNTAKQLFFDSEWTFPGFSINHNIVFQASFQSEDAENNYFFSDNFVYSRGYNRPVYDYIYKIGSNYHFTIAYPDWGFWGLIYFYRMRSNLFFDYSRTYFNNSSTNTESIQLYNSTGVELIFDTKVLNLYDLSFGVRYSFLLNDDPVPNQNQVHTYEFFIPLMRF